MTGPLILIGTMPFCHGGILSDDLTVQLFPSVHSFLYMLGIFLSFEYNNSFLCPKCKK